MSESKTCISCQQEVIGKYCHHCGQKSGIVRLSWGSMFNDLQQHIFAFDNKYFRTIIDLTLRPGKVIQSILDGVRVIYIGPVGFYFLMLTTYLLLASFLDIDLGRIMAETGESINNEPQTENQQALNNEVFSTITNNFRIFSFITVPFFVLGNFLFFRRAKMNFVEHSVVVFYALAWPFVISCFFLFVFKLFDYWPGAWSSLIVVVYFAWVCASFYAKNKVLGFIKGIFSVLFSYLIMIIIFVLSYFVYLLLNPELLKQFAPKT
ncbi:MAG: DUF3667 domain-containing protein [Bacteroidota bacterium]